MHRFDQYLKLYKSSKMFFYGVMKEYVAEYFRAEKDLLTFHRRW
jgi:hypothetical protein